MILVNLVNCRTKFGALAIYHKNQILSTPLQAVLCTIVIFSYCKNINKLFSNYSLWYVSDYIINKSLRNLLGCKVLSFCHFEPFCPFNALS